MTAKTKAATEADKDPKHSNKSRQKKDEAWKKIPPATGEAQTKKIGTKNFHWCIHHMAWTVHRPEECRNRPGAPVSAPPTNTEIAAAAMATAATAMSAKAILGRIESTMEAAARY